MEYGTAGQGLRRRSLGAFPFLSGVTNRGALLLLFYHRVFSIQVHKASSLLEFLAHHRFLCTEKVFSFIESWLLFHRVLNKGTVFTKCTTVPYLSIVLFSSTECDLSNDVCTSSFLFDTYFLRWVISQLWDAFSNITFPSAKLESES